MGLNCSRRNLGQAQVVSTGLFCLSRSDQYVRVIKNTLMTDGPANDGCQSFPQADCHAVGTFFMCWVVLCVCQGKTTIAHWVLFLTHELRWYCVTGVSLGIRKISIFQNEFNFVSSGHLSFQRLGFLTLNLKTLSSTYQYCQASILQWDICKVHSIGIGTQQTSNN